MRGEIATIAALPQVVLPDPISLMGKPNYLGSRQEIEAELDVVAVAIRQFHVKQPDQVMREIAALSARLTELCVLLHRVESTDRQYIRVRTQQVERYLKELDLQFKIASRMVELMRQDLQLLGK
jgi:hypothetical protein